MLQGHHERVILTYYMYLGKYRSYSKPGTPLTLVQDVSPTTLSAENYIARSWRLREVHPILTFRQLQGSPQGSRLLPYFDFCDNRARDCSVPINLCLVELMLL